MITTMIIGSDSGIGFEVAKKMGQAGHRVILVSRSYQKLDTAKKALIKLGIEASDYACDADNFSEVTDMFQNFVDRGIKINNLIFNVGNKTLDTPLDSSTKQIDQIFKTNVLGAIHSAKEFLKLSDPTRRRSIIFTGGGAAIRPAKHASTLSLTKAALRSYAYTLHDELMESNVFVGIVTIQGLINTTEEMSADKVAESYVTLLNNRTDTEIFYPEHVSGSEFD